MTNLDLSEWSLAALPDLDASTVLRLRAMETEIAAELAHGLGLELAEALPELPVLDVADVELGDLVAARLRQDPGPADRQRLRNVLMRFSPWRKGPFQIGDVMIDAEWRSDWKWKRVAPHLPSLREQRVLDVGCGNGYYLYRIAAREPRIVVGIDPFARYFFQFAAVQKYLRVNALKFMPVSFHRLPPIDRYFDTVFCMGVLYHQRSPLDFLRRLHRFLDAGGTLVIETLTIPGDDEIALFPRQRYAKMRNCFFLPTPICLVSWLERTGYQDVCVVDESITTTDEQRSTEWMVFESLRDFLDPSDSARTIEGYPAPRRTVVIAKR